MIKNYFTETKMVIVEMVKVIKSVRIWTKLDKENYYVFNLLLLSAY